MLKMSRTQSDTVVHPELQKAPASAYTHTVRSVQRMKLPKGTDAEWATEQYIQWLPVGLKGLLRVRRDGNDIHFTF